MPAAQRQKQKANKSAESPDKKNDDIQKPQWPQLAPLAPKEDLYLEQIFPGQIVTVPNFWTASLCKKYVCFLESLPLSTTPGKPKKGEAVRVNDRFAIEDPSFAEMLWSGTALKDLVLGAKFTDGALGGQNELPSPGDLWGSEVLGLNSNIRIYRYRKGQFFDQHYDESNNVTMPNGIKAKTTWTLLLYLTSAAQHCLGGETVFFPERKGKHQPEPDPIVTTLETGLLLLHKHGKDCMLHEGREVTEGEKWVIRTDLCVKR